MGLGPRIPDPVKPRPGLGLLGPELAEGHFQGLQLLALELLLALGHFHGNVCEEALAARLPREDGQGNERRHEHLEPGLSSRHFTVVLKRLQFSEPGRLNPKTLPQPSLGNKHKRTDNKCTEGFDLSLRFFKGPLTSNVFGQTASVPAWSFHPKGRRAKMRQVASRSLRSSSFKSLPSCRRLLHSSPKAHMMFVIS